ncbi:integrase, partial [Klebsiella quasipneumoniae]|nr:integrase [Klebsiella quasipneumoniae]
MGNAMVALKSADEVKAVSAELAKNKRTNLF